MTHPALAAGVLLLCGAGWGLTVPLSKIAVSTGHGWFGLIFWQLAFMIVVLSLVSAVRRRRLAVDSGALRAYLLIALTGTVVPNSASYAAAVHLPAGVMAIIISLVPIFALPLALIARLERFDPVRTMGLVLGALAVVLLTAPEAALPAPGLWLWVMVAALAPFMYAVEATWVAGSTIRQRDPVDLLLGASCAGLLLVTPLAVGSGQFIDLRAGFGRAETALLAASLIHAAVYVLYVWLVGRAGSVFAAQVSYLVTASSMMWSMMLLGESYSAWVWAAMWALFCGLFLVRPRAPGQAA
ncbi:MAG: DMT family transporter [Alphaproteobacteria bacterium]|nr:MAG: DMT family transporter [Alphaproteobacteria bacterium]